MTTITHVADYLPLVISVESGLESPHFTLSDGTVKGLRILLPKGAILDEPAILAFVAEPGSDAEHVAYEIGICQNWIADFTMNVPLTDTNNENSYQVIGSGEFMGGFPRGLSFVMDGGILNRETLPYQVPGYGTHMDGNLIVDVWFKVTGGHGSVKFSNVVLWFKRGIVAAAAVESNIEE